LALSNWKMAMTVSESLRFVQEMEQQAAGLLETVDVVICPPFTALWPVSQALQRSRLQLGAQDVAPTDALARTGEISAALLADVGCQWVMLGHWETRRHRGDDDAAVNRKVHLALEAGIRPILLVGEPEGSVDAPEVALRKQLMGVLKGCKVEQVARMAFVYEPEGAIGVSAPAGRGHVAAGCRFIRRWLHQEWGTPVAEGVRIIYGGSVAPENAAELLTIPDLDGLGATRRGRDPVTFTAIVEAIVKATQLS
jgi:triosephosphate isomerase